MTETQPLSRTVVPEGALSVATAADQQLTRGALSAEAGRLRDVCGLPLRLLASPRPGTRASLQGHALSLNSLIAGRPLRHAATFLSAHLPAAEADRHLRRFTIRFDPLWTRGELPALISSGPADLCADWRRRVAASPPWTAAWSTLADHDFALTWDGLATGDFDVSGRGRDYTQGMEYFQAARAFGVESLLGLLGEPAPGQPHLLLDVLGGDGYILRISAAMSTLRQAAMWILDLGAGLPAGAGEAPIARLLADLPKPPPALGVAPLLLLVSGGAVGPGRPRIGRVSLVELGSDGPRGLCRFGAALDDLAALEAEGSAERLNDGAPVPDLAAARACLAARCAARLDAGERPLIITNDLSPYMFRAAGLWGFPTREDARSLSRSFRSGSLDGVVFAYGTHHVEGLDRAIRESFAVLKPGGRIVAHDFLDEGQVGRWFHEVVDRHSRTGHACRHYGPIEIAVLLLLAGFRGLELYEMEDPFVFAVPDADADAREVACTYLLGMYGMTEAFQGDLERFQAVIGEFLAYPEIGNLPLFSPDLVYVPRRATVVAASRPPAPTGAAGDDALIAVLDELLAADLGAAASRRRGMDVDGMAAWIGADGTRWGVSPELCRRWRDWRERV